MKKIILLVCISVLAVGCAPTSQLTRAEAYKGMYTEEPLSILLMPPINKSTNVEAKEYFHTTLNVPLSDAGYYIVPPFLSMDILKRESAYDAELFLNSDLTKFKDIFGADLAVFTIIHTWEKTKILVPKVTVKVEYIIMSTKTNEVVYSRTGTVIYDTSVSAGGGGLVGALVSVAASAINTAATDYTTVAKTCNKYTFSDLPSGKYRPGDKVLESKKKAGRKVFTTKLNSSY